MFACLPRPLRYFLEPVAVALNHAERIGYGSAAMIGLSGGGWTALLYAALDTRVRRSYIVAGSLPLHVRAATCEGSPYECGDDFEQRMPALYRMANYLELHTLAAAGRRRIAFYNVHDPCCFKGRSYEMWAPPIRRAASRLAGSFDAVGDSTNDEHTISPFVLSAIEHDLR